MIDIAEKARRLLADTGGSHWFVGIDRIWAREEAESICEFPKWPTGTHEYHQAAANAEFIAAAKNYLIAALCAEIDTLRAGTDAAYRKGRADMLADAKARVKTGIEPMADGKHVRTVVTNWPEV